MARGYSIPLSLNSSNLPSYDRKLRKMHTKAAVDVSKVAGWDGGGSRILEFTLRGGRWLNSGRSFFGGTEAGVNHFVPVHIINEFVALIEKLSMNKLNPKNVVIYKFLRE